METIIGTVLGAIIAGGAMLLNAIISSKNERDRQDQAAARRLLEKELTDLSILYEDVLHISDRLIRNKGRDTEDQLEKFYKLEIKLRLHSTEEIRKAFTEVRSSISSMVGELPPPPEEFIPKFEEDHEKKWRLQKRKEWEAERDEKAGEHMPECWKKNSELAARLKEDLSSKKLNGVRE
jgi:gas vesicle protein